MQIIAATLCDYASVREGLLTVVGGGITRVWRPEVPAPMGIYLAVMLECTTEDLRRPHEVRVTVRTGDGEVVAEITGGFAAGAINGDLDPGESTIVSIPLSLVGAGVPTFGRYSVHVSIDDDHHQTLTFKVVHRELN